MLKWCAYKTPSCKSGHICYPIISQISIGGANKLTLMFSIGKYSTYEDSRSHP